MLAHSRVPMDVIAVGWAMRFCQASQAASHSLRDLQSNPGASLRIAAFSYVESASHTAAKFSRLLTLTADLQ